MIERPLVLFATPAIADKEKKYGGKPSFIKPAYDRQTTRLSPQFDVLKHALELGNIKISNTPNFIEPEYTLVFETVGDVANFYTAVNNLKKIHPNVEWLMELSSNTNNDEDFYVVDASGNRDDGKLLSTKIFCILTNQTALSQILSLWNNFKRDKNFKFNRGLAGFKQLFCCLKDVHLWGIQERLEDTGIIDAWKSDLQDDQCSKVTTEIELFYRTNKDKQISAERKISELVLSVGGSIVSKSLIPEIQYHALLVEIPRKCAQEIVNKEDVELILADEVMFFKVSGQAISTSDHVLIEDTLTTSTPKTIINEPIVALFDGMPQENHPLLNKMISLDDPDTIANEYPVNERIHATSMASLILHGQNMEAINDSIHRLYVRPIMKSQKDFQGRIQEYIPNNCLIVDKIHECIRRLFESSAGRVAPSVRIVNLSIGVSYREYYNLISPLARLLDWLSYKYRVLFIVSAGNHSEYINLGMNFASFSTLSDNDKNKFIYKYISSNLRNLRFLSPAESMNALTIGAIFSDGNDCTPSYNTTQLCTKGMPAIYSSFGRGINNSVKPDILFDGGRSFIREVIPSTANSAIWVASPKRKPGILSAYPGPQQEGAGTVAYSFGTSNSAALISNKAEECFNILNDVFQTETGEVIPYEYSAVLIKAMLVHGTSWSNLQDDCRTYLNISGQQANNTIHQYLGYGVANVDSVKECTKNQATLIGYGDIKQGQAYVYSIPLPFNFHNQKYKRKLTITLAYLSPIHPASIKYREKQVWFTIENGEKIAGKRKEFDFHAVQRGTLQHEIFEANSTEIWDVDNSLEIKVNCRGDASDKDENVSVPYALFATFEMAPEYDIDVYQTIIEKVRIREMVVSNKNS